MNVYHSQKTNFIKSMHRILLASEFDLISDKKEVTYPEIYLSAMLLKPSFPSASNSMSEKYAILGWLISRKLWFEAFRSKQQQSQLHCERKDESLYENQLCCLSKHENIEAAEYKDLKQMAVDINALMLSFLKYKEEVSKNVDHLEKKKMFFEDFAKITCNELSSNLMDDKVQTSHQNFKSRLNEILKHTTEFSTIYQCQPDSRMMPDEKCIF
ncbi:unnamed protein product [Schistosoma turkestanicum]|nr:unnamed protein product [Schistosoma turkestanicum]